MFFEVSTYFCCNSNTIVFLFLVRKLKTKSKNSYYLLICMLTQQLSLGLLSSFSVMFCFHFFPSLQVTLASKSGHASPSLLFQAALHAQQLPVEHAEQPLLGLNAGLAPGSQAAEQ